MERSDDMNMFARIEKERKEAEARCWEKDEKRKELAKDMSFQEYVKSVLEDEDIQEMSRLNEMFKGKFVDISKAQKYEKIKQLAKWLDANCSFVHGYFLNEIGNSGVRIDLSKMALFQEKDLRIFVNICLLADFITISGIEDHKISIFFGIFDAYSSFAEEDEELELEFERWMMEENDEELELEFEQWMLEEDDEHIDLK